MLASRNRWGKVEMDSGDKSEVMLPIMDGEEGEEMKEVVERNDVAAPAMPPGEDGEKETFVLVGRQSKTDEEKEVEIGRDCAVEAVEGPIRGFGMSIFLRCK
jgi:hypothetical protein